jgi:uncharacterized membrane protein YeaQ/YmgE (transglycosylase-associated protein family)
MSVDVATGGMHEIIRFLIVGFVAGWIAAILVRGQVRLRGCVVHTVVGMLGAVIGGVLFRLAGLHGGAGFIGSVGTATVGAVVFLVLLRLLRAL